MPPEPQLPLASQPPPPGSSGMKWVIAVLVVPGPVATTSAAAVGAAVIAVATAPATTSGLRKLSFANIPFAYHVRTSSNRYEKKFAGLATEGGYT